jgi:hypothetical protein
VKHWQLRYRHIHLDFHTSPDIPGIGSCFDKAQWQSALKTGHVNSITTFSKCHHGWSYHPTTVGKTHPNLSFDLLRAQMDAAHEIGVNIPIYLSAGVDNVASQAHPEWREIGIDGRYIGWTGAINHPGFHKMCFNTPYLEYLCRQIEEAVTLFPEAEGVFLDIISQNECCCTACMAYMKEKGLDADKPADRQACAEAALLRYYRMTTAACQFKNPDMPVFHNSGHIPRGRRDILPFFSHLELESLPTGGWGYDHYPLSAKYCQHLGLDFLGMTGKFHTTWGEFGGFKHPNALRYECAAMLAFGSKCSIGDQLHPSGFMDPTTYAVIGAAYAEVESKEPWCEGVEPVADIALLSSEAEQPAHARKSLADVGAGRVLLEEHFLFDLIDRNMPLDGYKLVILPDDIRIDADLKRRLDAYLKKGGKLLLSGDSGLNKDGEGFALDIGGVDQGLSENQPDYLECGPKLALPFIQSPLVMYVRSRQVKPVDGEVLASIRKPYFNRTWRHFCSHQHAPPAELTPYPAALAKGPILYLAHPVFTHYAASGAVAHRDYAARAIRHLLGEETLTTTLPSTARVSLMRQPALKRLVLHLLFANTVARGSSHAYSPEGYVQGGRPIEVIEELLALHDTKVTLKAPGVARATLQPQGEALPFCRNGNEIAFTVPRFACHQMIVLE